ncbi:hypothetical protein BDV11DRAFT_80992 [Aspergillus similis]
MASGNGIDCPLSSNETRHFWLPMTWSPNNIATAFYLLLSNLAVYESRDNDRADGGESMLIASSADLLLGFQGPRKPWYAYELRTHNLCSLCRRPGSQITNGMGSDGAVEIQTTDRPQRYRWLMAGMHRISSGVARKASPASCSQLSQAANQDNCCASSLTNPLMGLIWNFLGCRYPGT